MRIKLLGNTQVADSPERSVYSLKQAAGSGQYTFVVPVDIWFLERTQGADVERLRASPGSWSGLQLGIPNSPEGIASFVGRPPSISVGNVPSTITCSANNSFEVFSGSPQETVEKISKLPDFPRAEVTTGLRIAIDRALGEVTEVESDFLYEFLAPLGLAISSVSAYELRVRTRLSPRMIGSPVIAATAADAPRKRLGMLLGVNNHPDGTCTAFVLPAETLE